MNLFKISSFLLLILLLLSSSCADQPSEKTSSREVKKLTAFSKMYGYIKYFHPSDEARDVDWDKMAVLGVKRIKQAKTEEEFKKALEAVFLPIAPTIRFTKTEPDSNAFISTYLERIGKDTASLQTVAWQHLGVDMKQKNQVYTSSRTNRQEKVKNSHFYLYQNIHTQDLLGSTIRLRAMIKTTIDNQSNEGELILRLEDGNSQPLQTMKKTIQSNKSEDWTSYTIQTKYISSASQVKIGIDLKGEGKLWIDKIQLEQKKNDGNWIPVSINNAAFEDQKNGRPIGWKSTVTGNYEYRIASGKAVNGKSFYMAGKADESPNILFHTYPKVGATTIRRLATGLWSEVPLALYSDESHTLPHSLQTDFNRLKKSLQTIDLSHATANDENIRLADIIIAWNVLQHFYPYFDVIETDWEAQLSQALEKALGDKRQKDFNATLSRMLASTRDGHIILRHSSINNSKAAGLPFLVDWIENKVVVTHSLYEQIQPGNIVKTVDGKFAKKILDEQRKQISGSPQLTLFRSLRQLGTGQPGTEAVVEIQKQEGVKSYTIPRSSRRSNSIMEEKDVPVTGQIGDGVYYVDLTRASMDRINDEMDQIASSPGVIFDLRGYPTDDITKVIRHLLARPDTSGQWIQTPESIYPGQINMADYRKIGWRLTPVKPHIQGNVVFITDARAISYAESFMSFIEHYNLAEIVGQPTAGTNGGVNTMVLPGDYKFGWTGMKVFNHDGSQHFMIGIQPTIPVEKSIQGVREGKDEFLEKAIQVLK